jgi:hypothetical protein
MRKKEIMKKSKRKHSLIPLKVILSAIQGEEAALKHVLNHYERYIMMLASKELYDRYGNIYIFVDYELKTELQNKLVAGILKFRIV